MRKSKFHTFLYLAIVFPFATLLLLSLAQQWFFPGILPGKFTASNWLALASTNNDLLYSLGTSISISLSVAVTATTLGFIGSRAIAYHQYRLVFVRLLYLPFALASIIYAMLLQPYFIMLGLSGQLSGVLLGQVLFAFPYSLIYFQSFWTDHILQYQLQAETLGASRKQAFMKVLLPMGKSFILICFFQTFLISWFEYGFTSLVGVGKVKTMTISIFQYIGEANIYFAALASFLLIIPPVIFLWMNKRFVYDKLL